MAIVNSPRKNLAALALALTLAVIAVALLTSPALAHVSGTGPHNHDGNRTVDVYKGDRHFRGYLKAAMHNFREAPHGNAPMFRIVHRRSRADVAVHWRACDEGGAYFAPHHRKGGPDEVAIGRCSGKPIWALTHELAHVESLVHYPKGACYPGLSIMCREKWWDGHLTHADSLDLRKLPNKWRG